MEIIIMEILCCLVIVVLACYAALLVRARQREKLFRPVELRRARLVFAEKTFKIWKPMPLIARIDRGYRLDGQIHLVELKTRTVDRAYLSDIIELSAQKLAIEDSTDEKVSSIGYVVVRTSQGMRPSIHKVILMPRSDVLRLMHRRIHILGGTVDPERTGSKGLCAKCQYAAECMSPEVDQLT